MRKASSILCAIAIATLLGGAAVTVRAEGSTAKAHSKPLVLAQNDNYVACYKDVDMKPVLFRWCPKRSPYTPPNNTRNFCYQPSEACARAEMPQSWCIKCEGKQ